MQAKVGLHSRVFWTRVNLFKDTKEMKRFIQNYIIKRNNVVKTYNKYKKVENTMSIEDYLKSENKREKIGRFFIGFDYMYRDTKYNHDDNEFPALINYLRSIDNDKKYDVNLLFYLYDCYNSDVYDKSFEIYERYKDKNEDDCIFYDSDDSEVRDLSYDELDDIDDLEISKYILDFFKLHNINSNDDLQSWFTKTIEDYFEYIGLDINIL